MDPLDISVSSPDSELPEVELRFLPYTSTPTPCEDIGISKATEDVDIPAIISTVNEGVDKSSSQDLLCCDCALIKISQNIEHLTNRDESLFGEVVTCTDHCLEFVDPLALFIEAISKQVSVPDVFRRVNMPNIKKNMANIFSNILDKKKNGRSNFYFQSMEYLSYLNIDEQDRMVTFLNELSPLIVNAGKEELESGFGCRIGRVARKSLIKYMSTTSNFLSLQAVAETLAVFNKKGVDITAFLSDGLLFLVKDIRNLPASSNSLNYVDGLSNITRGIITYFLEEKVIEVHPLSNEEFINDDMIPSKRDLFHYFNRRESTLFHLVIFGF